MDLFQWLKAMYGADPDLQIPEGPPGARVRRRCRFSGLVQGVGFRYEAKRLADQLSLTGWVRNMRDGSVEAELEGDEIRVGTFLQAIQSVRRFDITDIRMEDLPVSGSETAFKVLY